MAVVGFFNLFGGLGLVVNGKPLLGWINVAAIVIGDILIILFLILNKPPAALLTSFLQASTALIMCSIAIPDFTDHEIAMMVLMRNHASAYIITVLCLVIMIRWISLKKYKEMIEFKTTKIKSELDDFSE